MLSHNTTSDSDKVGSKIRAQIVAAARTLKGVKYAKSSYSEYATDCYGVLYLTSLKVAAIKDLPALKYSRGYTEDWFREKFYELFEKRGLGSILPGSAICFRQSAGPIHCGITSVKHGAPYVIHSSVRDRKVVEQPLAFYPLSQIVEISDFNLAG